MLGPTAIVGSLATLVGTCLMMPQVYRTYATKSVEDLSWGMLALYFLNCALWFWYGALIASVPLEIANGVGLALGASLIAMKIRYRNNP